jgi:hypothetical protein
MIRILPYCRRYDVLCTLFLQKHDIFAEDMTCSYTLLSTSYTQAELDALLADLEAQFAEFTLPDPDGGTLDSEQAA